MAAPGTHVLRVALRDVPSVYRDIEIDSGKSLYDLSKGIVGTFDFDHAFGSYFGLVEETPLEAQPKYEFFADMGEASDAGSVKKTPVAKVFPRIGHTLVFLFDYGDEWLFRAEVIDLGDKIPGAHYPKVRERPRHHGHSIRPERMTSSNVG
ncbi:MAG TPA: hypothetical protein VFO41_00310 [Alphaproteobacteria bacterium]|nr:hypothetical protein [Alphaproteobacteria bacterium]